MILKTGFSFLMFRRSLFQQHHELQLTAMNRLGGIILLDYKIPFQCWYLLSCAHSFLLCLGDLLRVMTGTVSL